MTQDKRQQQTHMSGTNKDQTQYREFRGSLAEDYRLLKLAYPHLEQFQQCVGDCVRKYKPVTPTNPVRVVEIGCGDGITTNILLSARDDTVLAAIDIEPGMIERAKENLQPWEGVRNFQLITSDALRYLSDLDENSVDIIASVWTLHNFLTTFRGDFLKEAFRCLKPGGLFVNGDKYAQEQALHFNELYEQMRVFFDVYLPIGKYGFLKEFVLHNLSDEAPDRIMYQADAISYMAEVGFSDITAVYRKHMEMVLIAYKRHPSNNVGTSPFTSANTPVFAIHNAQTAKES